MSLKNEIGTFCWFSLLSKDLNQSESFYKSLFKYEVNKMEISGLGESHLFSAQDMSFADLTLLDATSDVPSHWIPYVAVENVDESCIAAEKFGGKVIVSAFNLPSIGRTAIVHDPAGTPFHLFTPEDKESELKRTGDKLGQICWMELMLDNPKLVTPFYAEVLGWQIGEPVSMGDGEYTGFKINGQQIGGFMTRPTQAPKMSPAWMPYFTVSNIDEYTIMAEKLGAKVIMEKTVIPETGHFSAIEDTTGANLYLFEYNESV
jgi:predicted enzyme related to lactoylglutathione lyase